MLTPIQRILGNTTLDMVKRYVALADVDLVARHRVASPADRLQGGRRPWTTAGFYCRAETTEPRHLSTEESESAYKREIGAFSAQGRSEGRPSGFRRLIVRLLALEPDDRLATGCLRPKPTVDAS